MARSRTPLSVSAGGASSSLRAWRSPSAGVLPSLPLAIGPLDAVDRIAGDGVAFAEVIEQRGQRRELAPDGGRRQLAALHVLAPGDDVRPGDGAQLRVVPQAGKGDEFPHVVLVGPAGFRVGDVGEPFFLGRNLGELLELRARQACFLTGTRSMKHPSF